MVDSNFFIYFTTWKLFYDWELFLRSEQNQQKFDYYYHIIYNLSCLHNPYTI